MKIKKYLIKKLIPENSLLEIADRLADRFTKKYKEPSEEVKKEIITWMLTGKSCQHLLETTAEFDRTKEKIFKQLQWEINNL